MTADDIWCNLISRLLEENVVERKGRAFRQMPGNAVHVFTAAPFVTARSIGWRNALRELEWLAYGNGHLSNLHPSTRHWWEPFAVNQQVNGIGIDIDQLPVRVKADPFSRRNVITSYTRGESPVPRNDFVAQATVYDGQLDLFVYQRTCEVMRGAPHNWLQFYALGLWCATEANLEFNALRWTTGNYHLYESHAPAARRCLQADRHEAPILVHTPQSHHFYADNFALVGSYVATAAEPLTWE
jgi:thymidylate synthase